MADPKEVTRSINRRVLVVDDSLAIHADFAKTLAPSLETKETTELDEFERELLGGEAPRRAAIEFHLDFAEQGEIGARKVEAAAKAREPYAMAFVDMRMPPGWDGLRTIQQMWRVDPRLEVVICTAFSDHTWGEIFEALGHCEQLLILKKPFDPVEVKQLAASLTQKWDLARLAETRIETLETRMVDSQGALDLLGQQNRTILGWVGQPVIALDLARRVELVNAAAAEALVGSEAELEGQSFHELIHPSHAPNEESECHWSSWQAIDALAQAGVTSDVFECRDGTQLPVEFILPRTRGGAVIMFCAVIEAGGF